MAIAAAVASLQRLIETNWLQLRQSIVFFCWTTNKEDEVNVKVKEREREMQQYWKKETVMSFIIQIKRFYRYILLEWEETKEKKRGGSLFSSLTQMHILFFDWTLTHCIVLKPKKSHTSHIHKIGGSSIMCVPINASLSPSLSVLFSEALQIKYTKPLLAKELACIDDGDQVSRSFFSLACPIDGTSRKAKAAVLCMYI